MLADNWDDISSGDEPGEDGSSQRRRWCCALIGTQWRGSECGRRCSSNVQRSKGKRSAYNALG